MALTDAQQLDVVRWSGYSIGSIYATGSSGLTTDYQNIIDLLDGLSSSQEVALTEKYITPLEALEAAILAAGENLDTEIAGPWTARKDEVTQRSSLFDKWRRDMVAFLGIKPGPSLGGSGGAFFVRA